MPVLGLTGSLASGKSTVLKLLKAKGVHCFDVDRKIHQYYRNEQSLVYKEIKSVFAQSFRRGMISRKMLAKVVFSDKNKLKKLEKIVHPLIIEELLNWIKKIKNRKGVYVAEVPLLFEKNLGKHFEGVILVTANKGILLKRIIKKYNFSRKEALNRLSLQVPIREKIKRADFVIDNNLDFKKLKKGVGSLWKKIK